MLLDAQVSRAELSNTFGDAEDLSMPVYTYAQFEFDSIKLLTKMHLMPIYNLILNYESAYGKLTFKMLHLFDNKEGTAAPVYFSCLRGIWSVTMSGTGKEVNRSANLLTLI